MRQASVLKFSLFKILWICTFSLTQSECGAGNLFSVPDTTILPEDTTKMTSARAAIKYLNSIKDLKQSKFWPNIKPDLLLENLRTFTIEPFSFYEGKATNFCAYSAITYLPLKYDPLGFAKFMVDLYRKGKALMGRDILEPSKAIREEAGLLKYKGALDINAAGQIWFLTLADHYKGYLNFLNQKFDKGDENTFWASTNYAKFNRMLRRLFNAKVVAKGADLIKPSIKNLYEYIRGQLDKGEVFLYVNNKKLYRKTHSRGWIHTPTHYILLTAISQLENGDIEFTYWDYGRRTLQQLSPGFLKNIIYGISTWSLKKPNPKN